VKSAETPFLADLFAISFRWLILSGFVVSLSTAGILNWITLLILALPVIWNLFVVTLATLNRRLPQHRLINIAVDSFSALLLFFVSGGTTGPMIWSAVLAVTSAGMYYELRGALLVTLILSILQIGPLYLFDPAKASTVFIGTLAAINAVAGLITGLLSIPMMRRLRKSYQAIVRQRKESEAVLQRGERSRMKALFLLTETLSGTLNYQTVLQSALDGSETVIGSDSTETRGLISAFLLFNESRLRISACRGFPVRDQNLELPAEAGALTEALSSGNPILVKDPGGDPELGALLALAEMRSALVLPLIRAMNAFGILLYAHPDPAFFTPERREMLELVSNQAVIAIQNARLFQDLALEKERIVKTQEDAQKKLARDLHDGPTQSISAIAMRLNITQKILARSPAEAAAEIQKIENLARRTTKEIRHMLFTLRPLVLETEGLEAALHTIADKMRELYQQNIRVETDARVIQELDMPKQTVVFYLCEEAVNNARKHAQATEVNIRLNYAQNDASIAILEIADDGVGFDMKQVMGSYERRGSLGMINLRERSELISALLKIESSPGNGTRIRVFIPLNQDAIDRLHQLRDQAPGKSAQARPVPPGRGG
jgi:signal transduction histidine kinase